MEAGRELDALIAEKVMGLQVMGEKPSKAQQRVFQGPFGADYWWISDGDGKPDYILPYSTEIAAAWEVVEKLRPTHNVVLECVHFEFNCHINIPGYPDDRVFARASTAPHAICLAALKAVEAK